MSRKISFAEFTRQLEELDAAQVVAVEGHTMTLHLAKFLQTDAGKKSLKKLLKPDIAETVEEKIASSGT